MRIPIAGPLSGMETALTKSEAPLVLIVGVRSAAAGNGVSCLAAGARRDKAGAMRRFRESKDSPNRCARCTGGELLDGVTGALEKGDYKM